MKVKSNKEIKTEVRTMKIADLVHAPWNPRGEITAESVQDLASSISANGLLQDLGGWESADGEMFVIYGNRRLEAVRSIGWTDVQVKIYDCDEKTAREITRIENEIRLGVDPLKDAELVKSMIDLGFSQKEIAAHFGVNEKTICLRAKLIKLAPKIKKIKEENPGCITIEALEHIAIHPIDIQMACLKDIKTRAGYGTVHWSDLSWKFEQQTMSLDSAPFIDCTPCAECQKRTGCQADLFGDVEEGKLGRCLDKKCFKACMGEWRKKLLDEKIPADVKERVETDSWELSNTNYKPKPSKKNCCAYYYFDYENKLHVKFGPSKEALEAMAAIEREARNAERAAMNEKRERIDNIVEKIDDFLRNEENEKLVWNRVVEDWHKVMNENADVDAFFREVVNRLMTNLDMGHAYESEARNAWLVKTFGDVIGLTNDECDIIVSEGEEFVKMRAEDND